MKRLAAYIRAIAILAVPLMMASAPPPASVQQSVVVPDGWVADVYLAESGICLRRVGGELLVGGFNTVWSGTTPIAQGGFVAAAIDRAPDGTLYVSEAIFPASLWRFPPDGSGQQTALWGFKYSHGVCVLPNGDVLALDTGWLNFAGEDGKIVKVPPTLASVEQLPAEVTSPLLINPASIELGPDGYVYFAERRYLWFQDGSIWRFKPGNPVAELVLAGLGDPFDTAWAPDGALFITDGTNLLRWHPQTGTIELWASGFVAPHGVDVAPNGDVYVADPGAGVVYRIHPAAPPAVPIAMSIQPKTINLKSQGQAISATMGQAVATAAIVAVDGAAVAPIPALSLSPVKFDRASVIAVLTDGERLIRVEGQLLDGSPYYAEAWVKAIH